MKKILEFNITLVYKKNIQHPQTKTLIEVVMNMENDKRRRERTPMNQIIELSTSDGNTVKVEGINISESGMLCQSESEIPQGTFVLFHMSLPGGKPDMLLKCEGIVLKCTKASGKFNVVIDFTDSDC